MRYSALLVFALVSTIVAAPSFAEDNADARTGAKPHRFSVGIANVYYPTSSKTRDRFGTPWGSIGISVGLAGGERPNRIRLEVNDLTRTESNDNGHAYLCPVCLSYTHELSESSSCLPYVGAGIAAFFANIESKKDDVSTGSRCLTGAKAFAGLNFGSWGFLEADYYAVPKLRGFDLSGFGVSLGIRF